MVSPRTVDFVGFGLLLGAACGPSTGDDVGGEGSTAAALETHDEASGSTEAGESTPAGSSVDSTTGDAPPELWTAADNLFVQVSCESSGSERAPFLDLQAVAPQHAHADQGEDACGGFVDGVGGRGNTVSIFISPWDGMGGTFVFGDPELVGDVDGVAQVESAGPPEQGEVVVEVSEPWTPSTVHFTIAEFEGTLDTSRCVAPDLDALASCGVES